MTTLEPSQPPTRTRRLSRRDLLALLGAGAAGLGAAAAVGPARLLHASTPPDGPTVPVPTLPPQLLAPIQPDTVADLAADLGWDVEAMFRFVADEVDYHPYSGVLRGATGALWSRAGNSADRALLLGALLDEAAVPWRLAVGPLDAEAAEQLADRQPPTVDDARRRAAEVLLPPDVAAAWDGQGSWTRTPEIDELFAAARQRVEDTVELLTDALTAAGAAPADVPVAIPADELDQHVWVQYADGPDWIDLDPLGPDAVAGTAYGTSAETMETLPDDRYHTVTLRVVGEVVAGGAPTRTELVTHTVRSADVADTPIYVVHAPTSWLDITTGLTGDQQYVATIIVGDLAVEGVTPVVLGTGEGIVDVLGDGSSPAEGQTIAEWFEVDVTVPGAGTRTASRLLYDRVPGDRRAAGELQLDDLPPIVTTHIDDEIGDVFKPFAAPHVVAITAHPLPSAAFGRIGADGPALPSTVDEVVARSVFTTGHARNLVALDQLTSTGVTSFADEPVVASIHMAPDDTSGDETITLTVDLVHVHRRAVTLDGAPSAGVAGIVAGALDHAGERFVVDGVGPLLTSGRFTDASPGRVFELAREAGIGVTTLAPGSDVAIDGLGPEPRTLIDAALAAGRYVVVPERTVELAGAQRIGWWEYDPLTGAAVDRMDDGGGASAGEYALLLRVASAAACFVAGALAALVLLNAAQGIGPSSLAHDMANSTLIVGAGAACVA